MGYSKCVCGQNTVVLTQKYALRSKEKQSLFMAGFFQTWCSGRVLCKTCTHAMAAYNPSQTDFMEFLSVAFQNAKFFWTALAMAVIL